MNKTILAGAIALFASTSVFAQDTFRVELDAAYANGDRSTADYDVTDFQATFYHSDVKLQGPYLESAFLSQVSFLTLGYTSEDTASARDESANVGGRFISEKGVVFGASYTNLENEDSITSLNLGKYIDDKSLLLFDATFGDDSDNQSVTVSYHTVSSIDENDVSYDFSASVIDDERLDGGNIMLITAGMDYFFSDSFSAGGSFGSGFSSNSDLSNLTIRTDYFFNPTFKMGLSYSDTGGDIKEELLGFNLQGRF